MPVPNEECRAHLNQLIVDQIEAFVGRAMPNYVGDLRPYFQPLANQIEAAIHGARAPAGGPTAKKAPEPLDDARQTVPALRPPSGPRLFTSPRGARYDFEIDLGRKKKGVSHVGGIF